MADFTAVRKFDSHTHVNTVDTTGLLAQAERDGFEILSINVDYPAFNPHEEQYRIALEMQQRAPQGAGALPAGPSASRLTSKMP